MSDEELQQQMIDSAVVDPNQLAEGTETQGVETTIPVMRKGNRYVAQMKKSADEAEESWYDISNFVMEFLRDEVHVDRTSKQVMDRYVKLVSDEVPSWTGLLEPDSLANMREFVETLRGVGDFSWYGNAAQFERIFAMAVAGNPNRKKVRVKNIAGLEVETGNFIVGNGAIDANGNICIAEEDGTVKVGETYYKLVSSNKGGEVKPPQFNWRVGDDDPDRVANTLMNRFLSVIKITSELWGPDSELAWGWSISDLFRSNWMKTVRSFPLLMMACPPGSGKNTFMQLILSLYGMPEYQPQPLPHMTPTGLFTVVNSACDIFAWLDEFKNDVPPHLRELLKSNADGSAKRVGTLDEFTTKSRQHRTGLIITGEFRAIDTALNQRCVLVRLNQRKDSAKLLKAQEEVKDLSVLLVYILQRRATYWEEMYRMYNSKLPVWMELTKAEPRIVENYLRAYVGLTALCGDPNDLREKRFLQFINDKAECSGNLNPAVEALQLLPRMIGGATGRRVWVPHYVKSKQNEITSFHVSPAELAREWCTHTKTGLISADDFYEYARVANIIPPDHSRSLPLVSMVTAEGQRTVSRRGWVLDLSNPLVKDVAEELEMVKR